jgi:hypothetical protein
MRRPWLVPKDAKELRVSVRWGDYRPTRAASGSEREDEPLPDGRGSDWQRTDRVEELTLKLPTPQKPAERDVPNSDGLKVALSV